MINKDKEIKNFIDETIKSVKQDLKEKEKNFDSINTKKALYQIGKILSPKVAEKRKQGYKEFSYVSWKWYEYILTKFDENHFWELSNYSDNYKMVQVKMSWKDKSYSGWYAVEDSAVSTKTGKPIDNLGEKCVNEGMRCYAKLASRVTGLFLDLWLEGSND